MWSSLKWNVDIMRHPLTSSCVQAFLWELLKFLPALFVLYLFTEHNKIEVFCYWCKQDKTIDLVL